MNKNLGLIGKKLGNTQIFDDVGMVQRVTVIECGPCTVLGKRTEERDGYSAVILGFGLKREKSVNKPEAGLVKKLDVKPTEKQELLEVLDLRERLERVATLLTKRVEVLKLSRQIEQQTKDAIDDRQRERGLREQLGQIPRELGAESGG